MDEVLFRSSQKLESLQYQLGIAATEGKKAVIQYSNQTKNVIINSLNSPKSVQIQDSLKHVWYYIVNVADELKCTILFHVNPRKIFYNLQRVFGGNWTSREIYFGCAGLIIGGIIGVGIGIGLQKHTVSRYTPAVQCTNYIGIEGATYVEDAITKNSCDLNEVLVVVKAGSVQIVDADICRGYGKTLRSLLSKHYQYSNHGLPVTLGRDCVGIVTEIGQNVKRFDIGDEVWLTAPFWAPGALSHMVYAHEHQVAKKPTSLGFEKACSFPYSGSLALAALEQANLSEDNCADKKIFVQGGCTPVGCVLIQILKYWGANVTTTCFIRSLPVAKALGADDVIILEESEIKTKAAVNIQLPEISSNSLIKELELRDRFDVIINTRNCGVSNLEFKQYCDYLVSTLNSELTSDSYGFVLKSLLKAYIHIKCFVQKYRGCEIYDFGEIHMCHESLDKLNEFVDLGVIKPLIDKVFTPQDIDKALYHIQSTMSIVYKLSKAG
ncbi:PREDICTED: reticulon-4-interacting protein 1 homolog, mitochondrial-like [Nicrophorus vespilloides]|uniref:Reticulon-4-interacting protein 1 homolog, mitochondrial-like n=1 Tax=Nicrophorus vespilloides TaxID=110193 RepID=A0ABM1N384_NICVS|nr:PREDICTED: reticulon-4-interacting protein 1 homolog, mitochondrial-like [Nicrophorus vespilloides]XP_017781293.1 PREDICTED: reticulon-4-interacting protein 1 homolog, mitochondrial-like [Nicrophorus vespilloides]